MPKKDELGGYALPCDGCGVVTQGIGGPDEDGLTYCGPCAERRRADPPITIHGRTLLLSELLDQADSDPALAAALPGDTVREQLREKQGAIRRLNARIRAEEDR